MERLTRQRTAVFSAFNDASRVLTAPEILAHARRLVPAISLSTVYRQVSALLADGEIAKVELPGEPARYEVACKGPQHLHRGGHGHGHGHGKEQPGGHHHHYFHCTACGQVFLLHACPGPMDELAPPGFRVTSHEVTLHGTCAACAAKDAPASRSH